MNRITFISLLLTIGLLGVGLRFINYDVLPPFGETNDEFFYPWAGMTQFTTGIPVGWSIFPSYTNRQFISKWDVNWPIVSPWLEKPPLYSWIMGGWVLLHGVRDIFDVRLSLIRLVPITLSFFTIILTGLLTKKIFSSSVGIIAALLYATIPTVVMANRMSLTENLLTPIILTTLLIFVSSVEDSSSKKSYIFWVSLGAALGFLTKQIGISLGITLIVLEIVQKKWLSAIIIAGTTLSAVALYYCLGFYYNWNLFINVQRDFSSYFLSEGLPQFVATIFLYPTVGRKEHVFLDGSMLMGYLLLFSSPLWLHLKSNFKKIVLLIFPLIFIMLLTLTASGNGFSFYGWHVFPLYPFLAILLAVAFSTLWQKRDLFQFLFFYLIIGTSSIRFMLLFFKNWQPEWQKIIGFGLCISLFFWFIKKGVYQKYFLITLFLLFLAINVYTIIHLNQIYPTRPQPY